MSAPGSQNSLPAVVIYFQDTRIATLFAHLIESMGHNATLSDDLDQVERDTSIITEPLYFPRLTREQQRKCLVIGDASSLQGVNALSIAQPLTEKKIQGALSIFLKKAVGV